MAKTPVSDVQLTALLRVSEFTSVNVVRQRGLRAERQRGQAERAPRRASTWSGRAGSAPSLFKFVFAVVVFLEFLKYFSEKLVIIN